MWQSWSDELQAVSVKLSAFGATRAQTQLSCVQINGQSLQLLFFKVDIIKIDQELCNQNHLDTMKLLNQHFSSKTWTNFEAFSFTSLRLIFILIQEYNTRSLEYQSLKRQPDAMCFEGSHQGMSGKTTKYRFQPHSERPAESLPSTKTCGSYMKLLRWCHECLSIRLWCNIDCMASFTELFFKVWIESLHFGESSATTKIFLEEVEDTQPKNIYVRVWYAIYGYLWQVVYVGARNDSLPPDFFSSVLGTTWSHRWSRSSARNPPTGCFVPHGSNLSKWMIFFILLLLMPQIPIQHESKLISLRNKCDWRWHLEYNASVWYS